MPGFSVGDRPCHCDLSGHVPRLVAITGGPGAGKTAVLEIARRSFCRHIAVLPEAAGIVFGGGFPRLEDPAARRAAQRAIYHVQRQLEAYVDEARDVAVALCDRGTLDGLAYWPGEEQVFWAEVGSSRATEMARYHAVLHMRTPAAQQGYDHSNALRIESASEAAVLDGRIADAWQGHPRRHFVESTDGFLEKATAALQQVLAALPPCCRTHPLAL